MSLARLRFASGHEVILAVGPHFGGRGEPIAHVVEGGHCRDVEDVAVAETDLAQGLAVRLDDLVGMLGELGREVSMATWRGGMSAAL